MYKILKKATACILTLSLMFSLIGVNVSAYDAISSTSDIIDSGYYRIRHLNSGKFLDVLYESTGDYATLGIISELPENKNQVYQIIPQGYGYYVISPCHVSNMALAVNSYDDYSYIVQTYYTGDNSQKWYIQTNSNGSYTFVNALTGNCINVYGNDTANDTPIISYHSDGTTAEQFDILKLSSSELQSVGLVASYDVCETYVVNNSGGVNVRTGAGSEYNRVGAACNGAAFDIVKKDGSWGYTNSILCTNGWQSGWVCLDYCYLSGSANSSVPTVSTQPTAESASGTYTVNSSNGVSVRTGAGTDYSRVGAARNGITFEITKKCGSWGYTPSIQCTNGWQSGWVNLDYCYVSGSSNPSQPSYSGYTTGTYSVNSSNGINVRNGAGTGYSRAGAAKNGITFEVSAIDGSWGYTSSIQCTTGWKSGWVNLDYCTAVSGSIMLPSYSNNGSAYLDVPMYLQGDKRWRSVKLGDTKYTIWGYGCTVTGLAMMYSYNNNCTIYPNEIIQYLKFNQYGAVYWSGIYNLGFTRKSYTGSISQNCMRIIYNQLADGRPVMIGATNSKGDEHWVVITGYSGDTNSFDPAYFSINDPAGNHTTLKQFLGYVDKVKYIVY